MFVFLGAIFSGIGALLSMIFCIFGVFLPVLWLGSLGTLFFVGFGSNFIVVGVRSGLAARNALMWGEVTTGRVLDVRDENGIWRLSYSYVVDGVACSSFSQTRDAEVASYSEGDPLHIVFDARDPTQSQIWPPVKGLVS